MTRLAWNRSRRCTGSHSSGQPTNILQCLSIQKVWTVLQLYFDRVGCPVHAMHALLLVWLGRLQCPCHKECGLDYWFAPSTFRSWDATFVNLICKPKVKPSTRIPKGEKYLPPSTCSCPNVWRQSNLIWKTQTRASVLLHSTLIYTTDIFVTLGTTVSSNWLVVLLRVSVIDLNA